MTEQTVVTISANFHQHLLNEISPGMRAELISTMDPGDKCRSAALFTTLIDFDRDALKSRHFKHIEQKLLRFAAAKGIDIDQSSTTYPLLLEQATLARIRAFRHFEQQALCNQPNAIQILPAAYPMQTVSNITIGALCQAYIVEKSQTEGAWDEDGTLPEATRALKTFRDIIGGDEVMIATIDRHRLNDYKAKLAGLPNQTLKKYAGKPISELLAMTVPKRDRIGKATLNHKLIWVASMFKWATINDYLNKNIAEGLAIKRKVQDKNRKEECDSYIDQEIRRIVETLTYDPNRLERFWGPLIAAHSGMRLNENGQMLVEDVRKIGGVLCFKVTIDLNKEDEENKDRQKKLKTQASKRNVPVHKLLLELGFEDYVKELRAAGVVRLFPNLRPAKRGYGVELGKWYGRTISKKLFPKGNRRKVFNSFRHSVEDKYKNITDMRDSMQSYLTGHATGQEDYDRYGSDPMAIVLKEYVDRIDYGLDIAALKEKMQRPVVTRRGPKNQASEQMPDRELADTQPLEAPVAPKAAKAILRKKPRVAQAPRATISAA